MNTLGRVAQPSVSEGIECREVTMPAFVEDIISGVKIHLGSSFI